MRITFSLDRAVVVGTTGDMNIAMPKERNFKMDKDWYYYRLLQLACPLMEKVRLEEGEFNAQDAVSLCKQIWELLNDFNKESKKYQFRWITHQDEVSIKSQNISIDFVAGEADWPGLYLYTLDNPEKFICITPGRISAV